MVTVVTPITADALQTVEGFVTVVLGPLLVLNGLIIYGSQFADRIQRATQYPTADSNAGVWERGGT